jgi:hypothetical protein
MKTKIEFNGIEVEVEFKDDSLSISVEKDGETIEDLMIPFDQEESSEEESGEEVEDIKPFDTFEEEGDFEEEGEEEGEEESESEEESEEEEEEDEESEEDEEKGGIKSFESFLNKRK